MSAGRTAVLGTAVVVLSWSPVVVWVVASVAFGVPALLVLVDEAGMSLSSALLVAAVPVWLVGEGALTVCRAPVPVAGRSVIDMSLSAADRIAVRLGWPPVDDKEPVWPADIDLSPLPWTWAELEEPRGLKEPTEDELGIAADAFARGDDRFARVLVECSLRPRETALGLLARLP